MQEKRKTKKQYEVNRSVYVCILNAIEYLKIFKGFIYKHLKRNQPSRDDDDGDIRMQAIKTGTNMKRIEGERERSRAKKKAKRKHFCA